MSVEHIEVLVEEPSMEAALRQLLPRLLKQTTFAIYTHQGKKDLLLKLPSRLRGYSRYLPDNWRIVILIDRDNEDCITLKHKLEKFAHDSGLRTRASKGKGDYKVINRIAVEELESWYFGDWNAVRVAYPKMPRAIASKAAYRIPDEIVGGTWEAFERVAKKAGYFESGLRKIEAASEIAKHMKVTDNNSRSFQVFCEAMLGISKE
jgi:hypothetical protein